MDNTLDTLELLRTERTQLVEETGSDHGLGDATDAILARLPEASAKREAALDALYADFDPVIRRADASADEPNDLDAILAAAPFDVQPGGPVASGDALADQSGRAHV